MKRRLERLLDEADEAADAGNWTKVREVATQVLLIDDANVDAKDFLQLAERTLPEDQQPATATIASQDRTLPKDVAKEEQPTSFADGRYQVQRFLGEGGKKKV